MKKIFVFALFLTACTTPQNLSPVATPINVSSDAFRAHVQFLASDLLEGREAGTRGYDIAASYVASQFELLGLEPAGDDGLYIQTVPLHASWRTTDTVQMTVTHGANEQVLRFKEDFLISNTARETLSVIEGETVFVGFGIDAPNRNHNDYADLDVRGKIVVVLSGFPQGWPSEEGAFYGSGAQKYQTAEAYGATAVISVYTDAAEKVSPWSRITRNTDTMRLSWINKQGLPHRSAPSIRIGGRMSPDAAHLLFEGAAKSYVEVREAAINSAPKGFPLNVSLRLQAGNRSELRTSSNIAGTVVGTDPTLRDEYVVITGHLDGLGIGKPEDGDAIYNGALDNATGIASMLEAARALKADPPRRSVMFLAVTAEEKGLLGAEYFALNPTVPIDAIVANINLDMPILLYDFTNLVGFGATHSSLEHTMRSTLESMGLGLAPDPFPQQAIFVRSDHYRFVQQGIPSIMLATGTDSTEGEGKGLEAILGFLGAHYHQPGDDLSRPINYAVGARFAEINYRLLKAIADADQAPTWNEGDFFGEQFSR